MTAMRFLVLCFCGLLLLSGCGRMSGGAAGVERRGERWYSEPWCVSRGGDARAVLSDGTRPDCVLSEEAVEFDFGEGAKPYECAGQARHYARLTGKRPLCVLIRRRGMSLEDFRRAAARAAAPVKCMDADGQMMACD